jgi:hypothetical protein
MKLLALTAVLLLASGGAAGQAATKRTPGLKIVQLKAKVKSEKHILRNRLSATAADSDTFVDSAEHVAAVQSLRLNIRRESKLLSRLWSLLGNVPNWNCIHHYEGAWNDSGYPYYGGLQMDISFQNAYGWDMLRAYGKTADHWHRFDQMIVAERARKTRGYWPWPNTARLCNLL